MSYLTILSANFGLKSAWVWPGYYKRRLQTPSVAISIDSIYSGTIYAMSDCLSIVIVSTCIIVILRRLDQLYRVSKGKFGLNKVLVSDTVG